MPAQPSRMTAALFFVIDMQLALSKITRADLARALGVPESTAKRRLEGTGAMHGGLDPFVDVVADLLDREPVELWADALAMWRRHRHEPDEYWETLRRSKNRLVASGLGPDGTGIVFEAEGWTSDEFGHPVPPPGS